jgi:hypothetical protein
VRVDAADLLSAAGRDGVARLRATGRVDAIVLGRPTEGAADPSTVAAFVDALQPGTDFVVEADVARDFPYNLARRIASLQALDGRAPGVLLPTADADAVAALHLLWQSWPRTSVLGDRLSRRFVDVEGLQRVDVAGRHPVAGPLQIPVDQADLPVVLQRFDATRPEESTLADVLVSDADDAGSAESAAHGRPVFVTTDAAALPAILDSGPDGVLVIGDLTTIAAALHEAAPAPHGTLRARWGLPGPRRILHGTPAFRPAGTRA